MIGKRVVNAETSSKTELTRSDLRRNVSHDDSTVQEISGKIRGEKIPGWYAMKHEIIRALSFILIHKAS